MKQMKKLASIVLALIMVLAMALPVGATGDTTTAETGTITIKNAAKGYDYKIYKILELESYKNGSETEKGNYSYRLAKTDAENAESWKNNPWKTFLETYKIGNNAVFIIDESGYVTLKDGVELSDADKATLAQKALENVSTSNISANDAKKLETTATETDLTFTDLPLGYYLVDSPVGTLCILTTTAPTIEITEKNKVPTLTKEVQEDSDGEWGKYADADRGKDVNFRVTIKAKAGAENYVLHDKMDEGLKFVEDSVAVTIKKASGADAGKEVSVEKENYKVFPKVDVEEGCSFHVNFEKTFCDTLENDDEIIVSYKATVQKAAWQEGKGKNEAYLAYGNKFETETDFAIVKTWQIKVFKYFMNGSDKKGLAGAKFTLSRNADGTDPIAFIETAGTDGTIYRVAPEGTTDTTVTEIETTANGHFIFRGLDSGDYYLTETAAPSGYNKLSGALKITVSAEVINEKDENGNKKYIANVTYKGENVDEVEVLNQSGSLLPSTGGIGTTIFYVVGGILVVGAAVLLVTRKRMSAEK